MNKNIEVINENLWAVNQHYVKNGYIKELSNLEGFNPELHDANLTNDGILILNTCSPVYDTLKKITVRVMEKADDELQVAHKSMQSISNPDGYEKMYLSVLGWEIKRRCVRAEYLESLPTPTLSDKIKNLRKKVKIWLQFKLR